MKKSILFALITLLAFTNITSAQLVFDGGPDGTGTDFFEEANWLDTTTGMDPPADSINPLRFTNGVLVGAIVFDLTISGDFAVVAEAADDDDVFNIRMNSGLTLTVEDNATLTCQFLTANAGEEINVVLSDNAVLSTERITRTAFELSEDANLMFDRAAIITQTIPVMEPNRINFSADWSGSVATRLPNGNRTLLVIPVLEPDEEPGNFGGLFDSATVDGVAATNDNFDTLFFGADIIHTLVPPPIRLGDVNIDGAVDFLDISPFILVLSTSTFQEEADIDDSGEVDFSDISPFIVLLSIQ